jgi:hypothetical protein
MTDHKRHARRKIPPDSAGDSTGPTPDAVVRAGESIQSAVDSASAGDVIGIEDGTFTEQVVVDEDVTLLGSGGTTISAPAALGARFDRKGTAVHPVVSLEADGAALRNLTVDGQVREYGDGQFVGVAAHEASVYVGDVDIRQIWEPAKDPQGTGILAYNRDDETERLVYVERCTVREYGTCGIVGEGKGLAFQIKETLVAGGWLSQTDIRNGIIVRNAPRVTIVGNTVVGNHHVGTTIAVGIALSRVADAFVAWNDIAQNGCGIGAKRAGDIVARQNDIHSNETGILDRGSATVDATNNWWGTKDGPSPSQVREGGARDPETGSVADGSGDAVYDVHWDPYSTRPFALDSTGSQSDAPGVSDRQQHDGGDRR